MLPSSRVESVDAKSIIEYLAFLLLLLFCVPGIMMLLPESALNILTHAKNPYIRYLLFGGLCLAAIIWATRITAVSRRRYLVAAGIALAVGIPLGIFATTMERAVRLDLEYLLAGISALAFVALPNYRKQPILLTLLSATLNYFLVSFLMLWIYIGVTGDGL